MEKFILKSKVNIRTPKASKSDGLTPAKGKIIPEEKDFRMVERNYPNESDAQKYRIAQACALLRSLD